MPGYSPQQTNYKARNANSVIILIGSQPIGFAQTLPLRYSFGTEGLYGIGSAMPQEIQQLKVAPEFTLTSFSLTNAGLTAIGVPVTTPLNAILANNQFNMLVVDGQTKAPLFTYVGAQAQNFDSQVQANQVVTETTSWLSLDVLGLQGQSILNSGQNAFQISTAAVGLTASLGLPL